MPELPPGFERWPDTVRLTAADPDLSEQIVSGVATAYADLAELLRQTFNGFFIEQRRRVLAGLARYDTAHNAKRINRVRGEKVRTEKKAVVIDDIWDDTVEDEILRGVYNPAVQKIIRDTMRRLDPVLQLPSEPPGSAPRVSEIREILAQRIVGVNRTTRRKIADTIEEGLRRGYSLGQIANGVPDEDFPGVIGVFDKATVARADTIARTEVAMVSNISTLLAYERAGLTQVEVMDGVQFDEPCRQANGSVWEIEYAAAHPLEHPNAIFEGTTVLPIGRVRAAYRAPYSGPRVTIGTAAGSVLAVSPNHPVLTERGWVPASEVCEGDHVIHGTVEEIGVASAGEYFDQMPALVEDVFAALAASGVVSRRPVAPEEFHGDGVFYGEVEVVRADGELPDVPHLASVEEIGEGLLDDADAELRSVEHPGFARPGTLLLRGGTVPLAASRGMSLLDVRGVVVALAEHDPGVPEPVSDGAVADPEFLRELHRRFPCFVAGGEVVGDRLLSLTAGSCDAYSSEATAQGGHSDPAFGGEFFEGGPVLVSLDEVVEVRYDEAFHGWAYDLETEGASYFANGCFASNCARVFLPVLPVEEDTGRVPLDRRVGGVGDSFRERSKVIRALRDIGLLHEVPSKAPRVRVRRRDARGRFAAHVPAETAFHLAQIVDPTDARMNPLRAFMEQMAGQGKGRERLFWPTGIFVSDDAQDVTVAVVHGVGHWLDYVLSHGRGLWSRGEGPLPGQDDLFARFAQTLTVMDVNANTVLDDEVKRWLLAPEELFARGYVQWVASRTRATGLRKQVEGRAGGALREFWPWPEFEPVAVWFDRLMVEQGWITGDGKAFVVDALPVLREVFSEPVSLAGDGFVDIVSLVAGAELPDGVKALYGEMEAAAREGVPWGLKADDHWRHGAKYNPNQLRDRLGRWTDGVLGGGRDTPALSRYGVVVQDGFENKPSIGAMPQPKLEWPEGIENIAYDDSDTETVRREIAEGKRDKWGDPYDPDMPDPVEQTPEQAEGWGDLGKIPFWPGYTDKGRPTQERIRDNLERYRRQFAADVRKTEAITADMIGEDGRSNWSGNVVFDADQLAFADGVKTWECDIVMLSSWAAGDWRQKRWYTLFHETLHAYSQKYAADEYARQRPGQDDDETTLALSMADQKGTFVSGYRYLEEGVVDGLSRTLFPEFVKRIGREGLLPESEMPNDREERNTGYVAWVKDLDTFAAMVNEPARLFYIDMLKLPNGEPRTRHMKDLVERARKQKRSDLGAEAFTSGPHARANAEIAPWRNHNRRTVVTEAERRGLIEWIDSRVWDPPSQDRPNVYDPNAHEGFLAYGSLAFQEKELERQEAMEQ